MSRYWGNYGADLGQTWDSFGVGKYGADIRVNMGQIWGKRSDVSPQEPSVVAHWVYRPGHEQLCVCCDTSCDTCPHRGWAAEGKGGSLGSEAEGEDVTLTRG